MITVVKADGSREPFQRKKVFRTCLRICGSSEVAELVSKEVEARVYDGISTKEILQMVFELAAKHRPAIAHRTDLRMALSLLRSKPDFEGFIARLFEKLGYRVRRNLVIQGFCIEHEIDVLAFRGGEVVYVEVKHHVQPHRYVDLDVVEKIWATLLDLREGYEKGLHGFDISKPLVATNTKLTWHASKYARCRGVDILCWNIPRGRSLEELLVRFKMYPVTILKGFNLETLYKVIDMGYMTLKELAEANPEGLSEKGLPEETAELLVEHAGKVLDAMP